MTTVLRFVTWFSADVHVKFYRCLGIEFVEECHKA